jgi:putative selenium metabolism hydrolase
MIFGVKLLADANAQLNGDLYVAFVVQEEPCEGMALQFLIEDEGLLPDFVVLGEPTNLGLYLGQRGRVELQVTTYGRSGHASMPHGGVNAISAAARLMFGIELLAPQLLTDPTLGQGTIAVTQIASVAGSLNSIPELCTLVVDRRLTLGETEARAVAELQQIIRREGIRADVSTLEYAVSTYTGHIARGRKYYPPWLMREDEPLARRAARALERVLGAPPHLGVWPFSTDGAYTMGTAGIPTIGFGPGDERLAHSADEQVRLADVVQAARSYAQLAVEILK